MIFLVDVMLKEALEENTEEDYKHMLLWIQASFMFASFWGLGGTIHSDSLETYDAFFKELWKGHNPDHPPLTSIEKTDLYIPSEGILSDYFFHFKGKGQWKYWFDVLRQMKVEETINIQQTLVPTVDTAK